VADGGSWLRGIIIEPDTAAQTNASDVQFVAIA
jgi:hypothetical protein